MPSAKPPVQYLAGASEISLESFELARLNRIANLRKELHQVMEEWIEAEVEGFQANIFGSAPMEGVRLYVASEDLDAARALLPPPIEEGEDVE